MCTCATPKPKLNLSSLFIICTICLKIILTQYPYTSFEAVPEVHTETPTSQNYLTQASPIVGTAPSTYSGASGLRFLLHSRFRT